VRFVMSAGRSPDGSRWKLFGSALIESALECDPSSDRIRGGVSGGGSRCSLFGTRGECELATNSRGSPVSVSTKTCSTSQSCQWKLAENWSNAEYHQNCITSSGESR